MRLLNVRTLQIKEFSDRETPSYAILSHTWGEEEVLLQDIEGGRARSLNGYSKIAGCCEQAKNDGLGYVVSRLSSAWLGPRSCGRLSLGPILSFFFFFFFFLVCHLFWWF